jgi:AsmA protein
VRKLLVGMAALVVVVITAAFAIPIAIPVEAYEGRLVALIKQATGRDFRIAGPVKLSLLPELTVEANDVSFGNAPDASTPTMVQLKQLRIQLQLWPLLHGAIVVNRLVLLRPMITLEVDKAGHANWMSGRAAVASAASARGAPEPPEAGAGWSISNLVLRKVRLTDGRVSYLDQRSGKAEQLDSANITLSLRSLKGPLAAGGSVVWHGEKVSFALDIERPQTLLDGAESRIESRLAAPSLTLSFSGRVRGLPSVWLAGTIDIETKSVRQLAFWLGTPITSNGGGPGRLVIRGKLQAAAATLRLTEVDLALDASKAKGSISIDTAGARILVAGELAIDRLDLDPYLEETASTAPVLAGGNQAAAAAGQSDRSGAPIGASPLGLVDVDFDLEIGAITYRKIQISAAVLGLRVDNGRLSADLRRFALYRGYGHGQVRFDGNGTAPRVGVDVALNRIEFEPLAQAAVDNSRLTGTADIEIAITARGRNERDLFATLSGKGSISLADGQIKGVDLLALAHSAAKIDRDLIGTLDVAGAINLLAHGQIKGINPLALAEDAATGFVGGSNATGIASLTATSNITNGVVRNGDLHVISGGVSITGAGIVDLRTRAIGYRLSLQLAGNIMVPIEVGGTWDNPTYRPDLALMLAQTPANAIAILKSTGGSVGRNLEGFGQDLKGIGQGAVDALKGLLGK